MDIKQLVHTSLDPGPDVQAQRRVTMGAALWFVLILLGMGSNRLEAGATQLTLTGTVEWRGKSAWSDDVKAYVDDLAMSAQYRAVFPLDVDAEGHYRLIQEDKMEETSVMVSGGVKVDLKELGAMQWTYHGTDPRQNVVGAVSLRHGAGKIEVNFRFPNIATKGTDWVGEPLSETFLGFGYDGCKLSWDYWWSERDAVAEFPSNSMKFTASGQGTVPSKYILDGITFFTGSMSANYTATVTEPRFEAVIIAPKDYDQWKPEGGKDEDTVGNFIRVRVEIRAKKQEDVPAGKGKFIFDLEETSSEPGVCMNKPTQDKAKFTRDLKIDKLTDPELQVDEDGQHAETQKETAYYDLVINSHDFGGYGRLKAVVKVQGESIIAELESDRSQKRINVPKDENNNHVADGWENEKQVYGLSLRENSDRTPNPAYGRQGADGDGISLYEKYRGLRVSSDGSTYGHERLDPRFKHLFIRNPDGLVGSTFESEGGAPESYSMASSCLVRYVEEAGWTGWGSFAAKKRIVNFNYSEDKHAIDQHALYVVLDPSRNPAEPADWITFMRSLGTNSTAANIDAGCEGATYPDNTGPGAFSNNWRPAYTYEVVIFGANVNGYISSCVRYHSSADLAGKTAAQQNQFILDYVRGHADDARLKRSIEMSATIAHELGHGTGINHHNPQDDSPRDPDLANCTMRYYGPNEFPIDPADRYELDARGNQPSQFCRKKHNCWGQLAINDNPAAPASPGTAPAAAFTTAWFYDHDPAMRQSEATVPVLSISADLAWPGLVEGDAVRLWGRLHGPTADIATNWVDGFQFTLQRVAEDGQRLTILAPAGFKPFVQPLLFDTSDLGLANPTLIREWLVTPAAAQLTPGKYALEIAWNGTGFIAATNLPADGLIKGSEIQFEVLPADNDGALGRRQRHLAWLANALGDDAGVLEHGREAARLDPTPNDPLAVQTVFLMSNAALRMGDPMSAALAMNSVNGLFPNSDNHLAELARTRFQALAPSVKANKPVVGSTKIQLEIKGLPGHKYILERSASLQGWTSISTNTLQESTCLVDDDKAAPGAARFYRVQWVR